MAMPNHVVVVVVTVAVVVAVVADGSLLKHAVRLLATRGVGVSQSLVNGRTLGRDKSVYPPRDLWQAGSCSCVDLQRYFLFQELR